MKLNDNILHGDERAAQTYNSLVACRSVEAMVHAQACEDWLCGALFFLFLFLEVWCFTAYGSSRGLISLQSLESLCKPDFFSCTIYSCETGLRSRCLHRENTVLHSPWCLQGLASDRTHTHRAEGYSMALKRQVTVSLA